MFRRKARNSVAPYNNERDLNSWLLRTWKENPIEVGIASLAATLHPLGALSAMIIQLVEQGVVTTEQLTTIGLSYDELESLRTALATADSPEAFEMELEVRLAIRLYDEKITGLIATHGLNSEMRPAFRKLLATFASDNSMTDLEAAYKFLSATQPDSLAPFRLTS